MSDTTKVQIIRDGLVHWETVTKSDKPKVEVADTDGIDDFSKLRTSPANACIYCGSGEQLSREHILAYAMGGTTTIPNGSCESCRQITHAFETAVLRGPMWMVRYIQNLPSGTKHRDFPATIPVKIIVNDEVRTIDAPRDEAPILLPFPVFEPPGYLEPGKTDLQLKEVVTGSFGADPKEFGKKHGASRLEITIGPYGVIGPYDVTAFARMLAKTAYAAAHACGLLSRLKNREELVHVMMHEPNIIGRFVGTVPEPYRKYPGLQHRISNHILPVHRILYSTVQLFASAGAPSYIVILGALKDDDPMDDAG